MEVDYNENYDICNYVNELMAKYGGKYYYICHDKDIDDNGMIKHKHYHLVFKFLTKVRKSTLINFTQEYCKLNNEKISVVKCLDAVVKYLIHYRDLDKHQYNFDDVLSNDSKGSLQYLIYECDNVLNDYDLLNIIERCNSMAEIARIVGSKIFCSKYKYIETMYYYFWNKKNYVEFDEKLPF